MKIKMLSHFVFAALLSIIIVTNSNAQGEYALPFILIQPGPNLNGMAGTFTALPTLDAFGPYYNPAQLGNFGRGINFSVQFYPKAVAFLPQLDLSDLNFNSSAVCTGYDLEKIFPQLPLSLGIGLINSKINLGMNIITDENGMELGRFKSWESCTAYSIGLGIDYFLRLNLGITLKKIESKLAFNTVKADAADYGMQCIIPVSELAEKICKSELLIIKEFKPRFDVSMGYAVLNVGDKFMYLDSDQKDPLPKQARMGYAVSIGAGKQIEDMQLDVLKWEWSSEAVDYLIDRDQAGNGYYVSSPGKIKIWDNVLLGKSDKNVRINKGWRVNLSEIFQYSHGTSRDLYYRVEQRTSGWMLSSSGIFKLLAVESKNSLLNFVARHIDIAYCKMKYSIRNDGLHREFEGIAVSIYGY
jgi:hypothetical protein